MPKRKGVLVYALKVFPAVTTTFIINEIWTLGKRGWNIEILSLEKKGGSVIHARAKELLPYVIYAKNIFSWATFKAHIYFVFTKPWRYISIFLYVFLFRILPYHLSELKLFFKSVYLAWAIKEKNIIHIHAHFAESSATCAMIISELLKKDFSFIAHGIDLFCLERPNTLREKIKRAKFVLTVSEYHKQQMATKTPEKIYIFKNSIIVDDFRLKVYGQKQIPLILTISRLVEKKGLFYLLEAYKALAVKRQLFKALIIGEGTLEYDLNEKIKEYNLEEKVKISPFIEQSRVKEYLFNADIFVLPCIIASNGDRDGMPYALVEAMASGLPVVSTYISGIPELINNGVTGFLVQPKDSVSLTNILRLLLRNEKLCERIGLAAREHVVKYHGLKKNIELLERLITE